MSGTGQLPHIREKERTEKDHPSPVSQLQLLSQLVGLIIIFRKRKRKQKNPHFAGTKQ